MIILVSPAPAMDLCSRSPPSEDSSDHSSRPGFENIWGCRWTITGALALGAMTLGGLACTTSPIIAGVLLALYILHAVVWNICSLSLRQRLVPDNLLGRVGAATRVLGLLGLGLGSVLGGVLGTIDLSIPVALGGLLFLGCSITAMLTLRGQLLPEDQVPARRK